MIKEPSFGTEESEVYGEVLDTLNRANVRYMLGGAVALNAYTGIWRETKDIDLFVPEKSVVPLLEVLESVGFETEITDPCWLAKACKGDYFADIIHANQNGALSVKESWFPNAKESTVLSRQVLVIPAEEMLLSKMFVAARDQWDMSDVVHLIFATQGNLDWGRILDGIDEHWELLLTYFHIYRYVYPSHTHYLSDRVMTLLQERYAEEAAGQGSLQEEDGSLRFRGTMLDAVSFGVDVEEWGLPDERAATREARCPDGQRG